MFRKLICTLALGLFVALPRGAEAQSIAGQWSCNDVRKYTGSLASSNEHRAFQMTVYPTGAVEGGGQVQMVNGASHQYSFSGSWQANGGTFLINGQMTGFNAYGQQFSAGMNFESLIRGPAMMSANWTDRATGTRLSTNCTRLN